MTWQNIKSDDDRECLDDDERKEKWRKETFSSQVRKFFRLLKSNDIYLEFRLLFV